MSDGLKAWLASELDRRGWSNSELARRAGISQAIVSRVLSGDREAGSDFCVKVALALNESPEKLLRLAGILPTPADSDDPTLTEIHNLVDNLPPAKRRDALRYLRFLFQNDKDE